MRQRTQVLIVGAGPVGQGLAIELGSRGIGCLVVDRNARIGVAPRAKTTNVRTREHFRRWGIADALRKASPFGVDYPSNIVFTTRLSGHQLARFDNALYCAPGRNPLYAEHAQWIPQYLVEQVMRSHIDTLPGVEVRMQCELAAIESSDGAVRAGNARWNVPRISRKPCHARPPMRSAPRACWAAVPPASLPSSPRSRARRPGGSFP